MPPVPTPLGNQVGGLGLTLDAEETPPGKPRVDKGAGVDAERGGPEVPLHRHYVGPKARSLCLGGA